MHLRSGHDTQTALTHREETALMADIYPTPEPEMHRTPVGDIVLAVKGINSDMSLSDEQRLQSLHHMLELCAVEHEREAQGYQVAHRHLVEHEGGFQDLAAFPRLPEDVAEFWEGRIGRDLKRDRSEMRQSRAKAKRLLKTIKYVEHQEEQMARLGVNSDTTEQSFEDNMVQRLVDSMGEMDQEEYQVD
ncbi:MAG: hypothetical protein Q9170_001377 [Blastenia crenularia]